MIKQDVRRPRLTVFDRLVVAALLILNSTVILRSTVEPTFPTRIVSVVPAVTEILFAIGAGPQVVGASSFARYPSEVNKLPRVGALLDPDVERVLSLEPDLVILYESQTDTMSQISRAGIEVFPYRHGGIQDVVDMLRELGRRTGHLVQGNNVAATIQSTVANIAARLANRKRPRVLLVIGREPDTIRNIYASGGIGFLNDMIVAAGGQNIFADVPREAVQPTSETILASEPDVIVEIRAEGMFTSDETTYQRDVWQALPAIPAVQKERVYFLNGNELIVPGPRLASGMERLARLLHPDAF